MKRIVKITLEVEIDIDTKQEHPILPPIAEGIVIAIENRLNEPWTIGFTADDEAAEIQLVAVK